MIFESKSQVVLIEVIVEPVVVRDPEIVIQVEAMNVQVAVRVGEKCTYHHLCHHEENHPPLNLIWDLKSTSDIYQIISFLRLAHPLSQKP